MSFCALWCSNEMGISHVTSAQCFDWLEFQNGNMRGVPGRVSNLKSLPPPAHVAGKRPGPKPTWIWIQTKTLINRNKGSFQRRTLIFVVKFQKLPMHYVPSIRSTILDQFQENGPYIHEEWKKLQLTKLQHWSLDLTSKKSEYFMNKFMTWKLQANPKTFHRTCLCKS